MYNYGYEKKKYLEEKEKEENFENYFVHRRNPGSVTHDYGIMDCFKD